MCSCIKVEPSSAVATEPSAVSTVLGMWSSLAGLSARTVRAVRGRDGGRVQLQRPLLSLRDGRRMTELAAHLVDRVIPDVPVRQWVLSLPWSLRYQLAFDAGLCRDVLAVFIRVVFGWLRRRAASAGLRAGQCGAVTVIQRFGSALNVSVHIHSLVPDGVFTRSAPTAAPVFHELPAPADEDVAQMLGQVHRRVRRLLRRRGRLPEEESSPSDPVAEWSAGSSRAPAPLGGRGRGRRETPVRAPGGVFASRERGRAGARASAIGASVSPSLAPAAGARATVGSRLEFLSSR